jgi:hypothetical protein
MTTENERNRMSTACFMLMHNYQAATAPEFT